MSWAQNLCLHLQINMGKNDERLFATHFFTNSISEKTEKFIFSTNYIGTLKKKSEPSIKITIDVSMLYFMKANYFC